MRRLLIAVLLVSAVLGTPASGQGPRPGTDNAAAFARLYGVVRYFYPSDAAATLDWNRFAVYGVAQARAARDAKALQSTLQTLFSPLGPRIEISQKLSPPPAVGGPDSLLIAWRYLGAGIGDASVPGPYRGKRTRRAPVSSGSPGIDGFATVMQAVPAISLRGRTIRLRGLVRATSRDVSGSAALWLRIDRPNQQMGFFDNMGNRPIRDPEWKEYAIEGPVAEDATNVAFGVMASGVVTADFERIELAMRAADGSWTPVAIEDAGFEAGSDVSGGWKRAGTSKNVEITRPVERAPEGTQFLRMAPRSSAPTPASQVSTTELFESPPRTDAHVDVDLGLGLRARVALALTEGEAVEEAKSSDALAKLRAALASVPDSGDQPDLDTRLADLVVAWNVFRHFYPYWTEAGVDWDARLRPQLELAYDRTTRAAHRDALRLLVADLRDGHGSVTDLRGTGGRGALPVQFRVIEKQLVVTATAAPADAPVGAIVTTVDGVPATKRLADAMRLASGSTQWKETRALQEIGSCPIGAGVKLVIDSGTGPRPISLACELKPPPAEKRPAPVTELLPGVWYVDLTRARMPEVKPILEKLASAEGVVFDVRGYPTDAGAQILPHLLPTLATSEADRWMHVNKIVGPFGESAGWQSVGWNITPQSPRVGGKIMFLTDGRAISYAESVMGYIADRKLGTIVGSATAGANGNVVVFVVPGGFRLGFTGMRVTGHDGQAQHHLVGIKPDIPIGPTIAGLRAGRDEVLDRALATIRGQ
jgi:hypothetical protein